jgi:hypothetical protein
MKKIMLLAVTLVASVAGASELWWTVNVTGDAASSNWDTARVYYFNPSDLSNRGQLGTVLEGTASKDALAILDYAASTISGDKSAYSFYVELYNAAEMAEHPNNHLGAWRSEAVAYNDLAGSIYAGGTSYGASPYEFSNFSAQVIPEPSSGLMMLLGMIALGLKRKKV